jgi:manganese transport protein
MATLQIELPGLGPLSERTRKAAREVLDGRRRGVRALLPFAGPAFIASVAYMDPGNYATNLQSGSSFGYDLLWVVVLANVIAMLFQALSAKLGIVSGKNLPEVCRDHLPKPVSLTMWGVSEIGAMATDLAEFLGAVIALNLLFHVPLLGAAIITGAVTYALLQMQRWGFRPLEALIGALVGVIALCYVVETVFARPDWGQIAYHSIVPSLAGPSAILLAVGIVGATVMPHAIYLHSSLTQDRVIPVTQQEACRITRFSNIDVFIALGVAGVVNMSMMYMAAAAFHSGAQHQVADINSAYKTLTPLLGNAAAVVFLISLLASGISSSVVGTLAGQVIMQGFLGFAVPLWLRRLVTMLPAIIIIALGVNLTKALVLSQVVLSLILPVPVIALIFFTQRQALMGALVNKAWLSAVAAAAAAAVIALNVMLIVRTLT